MNNQNLIIYEFDELYNVLFEIKKDINLNLKKASKNDISELSSKLDCLIFTQNKISGLDNQIIFDKFPISILKLLENGEFDEAEKYAQQEYHAGNITKQFYTSLITSDIANFRAFKDKPVFGNLEYKGIIDALKVEMASGKNAGNRIEASQANTYIQTRMMKWYRLYHNHKDYILEDGSFDDLKFEDDFLNYFRNMLTILRSTKGSNGDLLFPSLEWTGMKETKTITSILDKKMGELNK